MPAPRVVLDTHILLDCWVFDDERARPLRGVLESRRVVALRCARTDAELEAVLPRPRFALDEAARQSLLARWQALAVEVPVPSAAPLRCADTSDQKFLDLAQAGGTRWLVTRDKALLVLARRARASGLAICPATEAPSAMLVEDGLP
jgi:predicted nucleic acid-binding protein